MPMTEDQVRAAYAEGGAERDRSPRKASSFGAPAFQHARRSCRRRS
jgi:hypothetical protein